MDAIDLDDQQARPERSEDSLARGFLFQPRRPVMLPIPSDLDIFRSAKLLIDQHGADAAIEAARRADALLDKGDLDGRAVWLRIQAAVGVLLKETPGDRETVH